MAGHSPAVLFYPGPAMTQAATETKSPFEPQPQDFPGQPAKLAPSYTIPALDESSDTFGALIMVAGGMPLY